MKSLNLTKQDVGRIFRHGAYDGVYASNKERVAGGGSLSLMEHFARWCDKEISSVTGHWDIGHRLQLVYDDVLKKSSDSKMFLRIVDVAKGYCTGKDGLLMHEFVLETKASFLEDKSEQTTRWVRSILRVIEAFYRNLSTVCQMIGRMIENARQEEDLTEQKACKRVMIS